ncbi:TIGR03905 family TSCPD domain-containing protein [Alkalibacter rhizosphaerae]|uniref:ribonucleoside-diphosphate reductase n=1 Tax=Alkalibacter rhizosphaerae TaxID=2815577 RepID=A0A975AI19_9FIRM|nr:TIGR03905 family TSCPD domain-containing protein [Alkalibacter rhizosphaerae]QSX08618.1 TIGR03905 family TSCPD domain-containing protein [Alkalibacter rhizosphaerae]
MQNKIRYVYKTKGVCAREIEIELEGRYISNVEFIGGCAGNAIGLSSLVVGMDIEDVIQRLEGIPCGSKITSCPDQLSEALCEIIDMSRLKAEA